MAMAKSFNLAALLLTLTCLFCCYSTISSSQPSPDRVGFYLCVSRANVPVYGKWEKKFNWQLKNYTRNARFLGDTIGGPLYIMVPANTDHVQDAVLCGSEKNMLIRVRSGGHDYEGLSYRSRDPKAVFALLDMSNLTTVKVDLKTKTAWVDSGASLGQLYYEIGQKSSTLGFPAGVCPTVGVGGQFSGGGFGTLFRKYGLSIDNIINAELVDAKGRLLDNETMGSDVFWAIRGGGGSFGVVVRWQVKLVPVPAKVAVFTVSVRQGVALEVHKWQQVALAPKLPGELYIRLLLTNKTANFRATYLGSCDALLRVLSSSYPQLMRDRDHSTCEDMTWVKSMAYISLGKDKPVEAFLDRTTSADDSTHGFKATTDYIRHPIPWNIWSSIFSKLAQASNGQVILVPYGGQMDNVLEDATPFPHRKGVLYQMQVYNRWPVATGNEAEHTKWVRDMYEFMAPYIMSSESNPREAYVNCRDLDLGPDYGRKYFEGNYERLMKSKALIDPDNYFNDEQSIPLPSSAKYAPRLQRSRPLSSSF